MIVGINFLQLGGSIDNVREVIDQKLISLKSIHIHTLWALSPMSLVSVRSARSNLNFEGKCWQAGCTRIAEPCVAKNAKY